MISRVIADASPVGLGAVLIQFNEQNDVCYASKSISKVEERYCQTEKEALALVWSVERFHFYVFGKEFELITDHKPLVIFERWVLRIQSYNYKVIYKPGKENIADSLSRLTCNYKKDDKFNEDSEHYVNFIISNALPKAIKLDQIVVESVQDLFNGIRNNVWNQSSEHFRKISLEMCEKSGVILRGTSIFVPKVLRNRILELAHEGHPEITLMKQRLRAKVWWPKIDMQVDEFVKNCQGCFLVSAPPVPEPMKRTVLPHRPWEFVAIDLCGPLPTGHHLFVIVDYFSRFVEVEILKKIDSTEIIRKISIIFARFGYPEKIIADNGRQFISEEFKNFCETNNIQLLSSIPYWS